MYVYKETDRTSDHVLYTVGYHAPDGKFEPESDHTDPARAADRVAYLNGGHSASPEAIAALVKAEAFISGFEGDTMQEGIDELLSEVRALIQKMGAPSALAQLEN
ncbi:hypothetical protein [Burkholderia vietnamiensis]|uniref:hypothetical protein n=1 Tax=Burkholderia vietnamiensis TaxID=60552 RepID=UPI000A9C56E8|nr:hypothetical protein [Burkholderia vietnamiensis]